MQSISYTKITSKIILWIRKVLCTYHHCLSSNHHENIIMTNKWSLLWNLFGEIRCSYHNSENDNLFEIKIFTECFKICHIYGKRKLPYTFFVLFSFQAIPHFYHVNTLVQCPCRHRPELLKMKNEKNYMGFLFR